MVSICDMCDGEFPDGHKGSYVGGAFWYCDSCTKKHNEFMDKRREERKVFLNSAPDTLS